MTVLSKNGHHALVVGDYEPPAGFRLAGELREAPPDGDTRDCDGARSLRVVIADDCKGAADSLALLVRLWGMMLRWRGQSGLSIH
jgi:hypothetical protein